MLVFDDEQRGLGVRVTASGGKTYLAQYNWHGQKRRIPLGNCNAVSLAKARDAVRLIMGDAVAMIAVGIAIALPCVAALGKLVQSQLFGVTATDPATVAAAALILAAGALAAAFIPAWRASNVSPTDALRLE